MLALQSIENLADLLPKVVPARISPAGMAGTGLVVHSQEPERCAMELEDVPRQHKANFLRVAVFGGA
jgi:hypothetical protein